jgi:endonuclease/exonuclease/phosphatase (EEP) superfamily protein YafD
VTALRYAVRLGAALVLTGALAVVVLPDLAGLDHDNPFAAVVALRPWTLAVTVVIALLFALLTWRRRGAWPFLAGALAVAVVGAVLVVPRAIPGGAVEGRPLTIMVANVYLGRADPAAFTALVRDNRPDVVAVPEGGDRFRERVTPLVAPLGYRVYTSAPGAADVASVDALVSERLGAVQVAPAFGTSPVPYLRITGGTLGAVQVVAFHAGAPTPALIAQWRADMSLLSTWCGGATPTVVAGDFNATLDHSLFRKGSAGCSDAAAQTGNGLVPTWGPYGDPALRTFGPQIDHVLSTAGIGANAVTVDDLPGSDHRAVVAQLAVAPGG